MKKVIISGIQQVGVGIPDVYAAWKWFRQHFGMDIPVFEEAAEANLMLPYTNGKPWKRHAILAANLQGGGGMEIWQYTGRTPQPPAFEVQVGDLGIYTARIKARNIEAAFAFMKGKQADIPADLCKDPGGNSYFWVKDRYQNLFQVVTNESWFANTRAVTGGVSGCMIGVSDIDKALRLYSGLLGYDEVVYDKKGAFADLAHLPGGQGQFRRVLLSHTAPRKGIFSNMFGKTHIELIQALDRSPRKIFEGRQWGDLGFIHLCFDISGMDALREQCAEAGFPFTVDSATALGKVFDMGEASGQFSYIEDLDGTLIEFVETLKLPIAKKMGWYLNVSKRDPEKPLPNWMLKALALNRVKD